MYYCIILLYTIFLPSRREVARSQSKIVRVIQQTVLRKHVHRAQVRPARELRLPHPTGDTGPRCGRNDTHALKVKVPHIAQLS